MEIDLILIQSFTSKTLTFLEGTISKGDCVCTKRTQKQMLEWLLAPDKFWPEGSLGSGGRQEYFLAEHVSLSSGGDLRCSSFALLCMMGNVDVRAFFVLIAARSLSRRVDAALFCWALPQPLSEVCRSVFNLHHSSSVILSLLGLSRGNAKCYWSLASWMFSESDCHVLICSTLLI